MACIPLWDDLKGFSNGLAGSPWLILGDFNAVLYSEDRINGNSVSAAETKDFQELIDSTGLYERVVDGPKRLR